VVLTIPLKNSGENLGWDADILPPYFRIELSTEKEWLPLEYNGNIKFDDELETDQEPPKDQRGMKCRYSSGTDPKIEFILQLLPDAPPIAPFLEETEEGIPIATELPCVKVFITNTAWAEAGDYKSLMQAMAVKNIELRVKVKGLKNLLLRNDNGDIDVNAKIYPFTQVPNEGAQFTIGSGEVFSKELKSLDLNIKWDGLEGMNFGKYYRVYNFYRHDKIGFDSFKFRTEYLKEGVWKNLSLPPEQGDSLFSSSDIDDWQEHPVDLEEILVPDSIRFLSQDAWKLIVESLSANEPQQGLDAKQVMEPLGIYLGERPVDEIDYTDYVNEVLDPLNFFHIPDPSMARAFFYQIRKTESESILKIVKKNDGIVSAEISSIPEVTIKPGVIQNGKIVKPTEVAPYSEQFTTQGFIRLVLGRDFLHEAYGKVLAQQLMVQSEDPDSDHPIALPEPPFTPVIDSISVDYEAATTLNPGETPSEFFQLTPMRGNRPVPFRDGESLTPLFLHKAAGASPLDIYQKDEEEEDRSRWYLGIPNTLMPEEEEEDRIFYVFLKLPGIPNQEAFDEIEIFNGDDVLNSGIHLLGEPDGFAECIIGLHAEELKAYNELSSSETEPPNAVDFKWVMVRSSAGSVTHPPAVHYLLYPANGNLFIGLRGLTPGQIVSILFQVEEASGDPDAEVPEVHWDYLADNEWKPFPVPFIVSDETLGLRRSGIIQFRTPLEMAAGNTILNPELYWIRASVTETEVAKIAALPNLIDVRAQAVRAVFLNRGNSLEHLQKGLPAATISQLVRRDVAVTAIEQPFASFDGIPPESGKSFYQRVSERLRHKDRAITVYDYERLVLQHFPDIYHAKCLNHTDLPVNLAPGYVTLAVIPNLKHKSGGDPYQPRVAVGARREIELFLNRHNTPMVAGLTEEDDTLEVVNPVYEPIKVCCCVQFRPGYDPNLFKFRLNEELKQFLAPWAFDSSAEIAFGKEIFRFSVLNFIEERDYVDIVTDFELIHYVKNENGAEGQKVTYEKGEAAILKPQTARSILTTYINPETLTDPNQIDHHIRIIEFIETDTGLCPSC
ncbi:MAG: hypothetical protein KDC75_01785, partial [Phaeodactylibacter sp.]|nr:hypothetical protein [Phaeodactylibacter sp.]